MLSVEGIYVVRTPLIGISLQIGRSEKLFSPARNLLDF